MDYKIIIGLVIAFGFIGYKKHDNKFIKIVFITQLISLGLGLLSNNLSIELSVFLFALSMASMIIYTATNGTYSMNKKGLIILIAFPYLLKQIFAFQHYPFANEINLLLIVPIASWTFLMIKKRSDYTEEIGVLNIFTAMSTVEMITYYG